MFARSISPYVPGALLVLSTGLVLGNWYLRPDRAIAWSISIALLGFMSLALLAATRSSTVTRRCAGDAIRSGVGFGALMMLLALAAKFATSLGVGDADLARRATMASFGAFLVFTGNAMPKTLTPLSRLTCDAGAVQAFQRFSGWTWVLTGCGYAIAWLMLPLTAAKPVSVTVLVIGMALIVGRMTRWHWASTK